MMKINPIQLHFFPKKKTNNSIHSLYMRMQIGSERCDISLKYELSKESWDKSNQRLKPKHPDQTRVSVLMNEYRHRAHAIYQESIQLGKSPSVFDVRNELLGIPDEGVSASCSSGTRYFVTLVAPQHSRFAHSYLMYNYNGHRTKFQKGYSYN